MAIMRKVWAISLPPKMEKEIALLAKREEKTKSELIRSALRLYTEQKRKGKAKADSDIDLCVISPDFGRDDVEEGQYLFKKTIGIDSRIEPVGYSVQSFATEESPLIAEIKRYGRRISKNT